MYIYILKTIFSDGVACASATKACERSYSLLIYTCKILRALSCDTHVKTRRNAATFTRSLFAGNCPQRLIFDGRFHAIVTRGTTYDNTTVIIPTDNARQNALS